MSPYFGPISAIPNSLRFLNQPSQIKPRSMRQDAVNDIGDPKGAKHTPDIRAFGWAIVGSICLGAGLLRTEITKQNQGENLSITHEDFNFSVASRHSGNQVHLKGLTISDVNLEFVGHVRPENPHQVAEKPDQEEGLHHCYKIKNGNSTIIVLIDPIEIFSAERHRIINADESLHISVRFGDFTGATPVIYCEHPDKDSFVGLVAP